MISNLRQYRLNNSFLFAFILFTLNCLFIFLPGTLGASQVSLEWNQNSEADLAGYRVFCREQDQSFNYANPCWEGTNNYSTIYNLDETKSYCFAAKAVNTNGFESQISNTVCRESFNSQNEPPIAVVTPNYIETTEGTLVLLDGSASTDSDDGIASYLWSQIEGETVTLSDPTRSVISFTAPETGLFGHNIHLKLTVRDHGGLNSEAEAFVYVIQNELPNNSPAADFSFAGRNRVVAFTDKSVDSDGIIVSWLWNFGDGKSSTEQNPRHRYAKFKDYIVTLTVTDDAGASSFIKKSVAVRK